MKSSTIVGSEFKMRMSPFNRHDFYVLVDDRNNFAFSLK